MPVCQAPNCNFSYCRRKSSYCFIFHVLVRRWKVRERGCMRLVMSKECELVMQQIYVFYLRNDFPQSDYSSQLCSTCRSYEGKMQVVVCQNLSKFDNNCYRQDFFIHWQNIAFVTPKAVLFSTEKYAAWHREQNLSPNCNNSKARSRRERCCSLLRLHLFQYNKTL